MEKEFSKTGIPEKDSKTTGTSFYPFMSFFTITPYFSISPQKMNDFNLTFRYRNSTFRDKRTGGLRSPFKKGDICQSGAETSRHSDKA